MAGYAWTPTQYGTVSLTTTPFLRAYFDPQHGPAQMQQHVAVKAAILGRGSRHVRAQPQDAEMHLIVQLDNVTQTEEDTLAKTFDQAKGEVYLLMTDGAASPNTWRVAVFPEQIKPDAANIWRIILSVADPVFELNTQTSNNGTSGAGPTDSFTIATTNPGNRAARPILGAVMTGPKSTRVHDWKDSLRWYFANRTPNTLDNYPIELLRDGGAFDHTALVTQAGNSVQINQVGGISATDTTIPYDTPSGGGIDSPDGMIIIGSEQIYYTGGGGGSPLTGCVRGVGGTTAAAHADNAIMTRSRSLANGNDLAVWVNGMRLRRRYLFGANTTDLRCWIAVSAPPALALTPTARVTSTSPATGGALAFVEDISTLILQGARAVQIETEIIAFADWDIDLRKVTGITRGAWGTTAATHAAAATAARVDALGVIGLSKASEGSPDAPLSARPAPQLNSRNNQWRFGDTGTDPSSTFYDSTRPARPGSFHPSPHVPEADLNAAQALQLAESAARAEWKDAEPAQGKLQVGRLTLPLPVGIEASAAAITVDAQTRDTMRLRILGRDSKGLEVELADYFKSDELLLSGQTITPADKMHELTLQGVRAAVCGNRNIGTDLSLGSATFLVQKVVLDHETELWGLHLRLKKAGAGDSFTGEVFLLNNNGGDASPESGQIVCWFNRNHKSDPLSDAGDNFTAADLATSYELWEFAPVVSGARRPVILAAGTYWIRIGLSAWTSGTFSIDGSTITETKHNLVKTSGLGYPASAKSIFFRLLHRRGGPVQPEARLLNEDSLAHFDGLILELDDATAPLIGREALGQTMVHTNARMTSDKNAKAFTLDAWMVATSGEIEIDCAKQVVTQKNGSGHTMPVPHAVLADDDREWFLVAPGANVITQTEENMATTTTTAKHRGRFE